MMLDCSVSDDRATLVGLVERLTRENKVLKEQIRKKEDALTKCEPIIAAVAQYYGIPEIDILSRRKNKLVSLARQVAVYVCAISTNVRYVTLGRLFGRDHTTIIYHYRKITNQIRTDKVVKDDVDSITTFLKRSEVIAAVQVA